MSRSYHREMAALAASRANDSSLPTPHGHEQRGNPAHQSALTASLGPDETPETPRKPKPVSLSP